MTRIVCISDTHTLHKNIEIPECDILIHSGDACGHGYLHEYMDFAKWFNAQKQAKNRIFVPGNHDRCTENTTYNCQEDMQEGGSIFLADNYIELCGLRIFGTPWTPEFCGWAWQGDDTGGSKPKYKDLHRHFGLIPEVDVLICHGPAYGHLDRCPNGRVGSFEMLRALERIKPKLFAHGHIHESYGETWLGQTKIVNASIAYDYVNCHKPIIVDL